MRKSYLWAIGALVGFTLVTQADSLNYSQSFNGLKSTANQVNSLPTFTSSVYDYWYKSGGDYYLYDKWWRGAGTTGLGDYRLVNLATTASYTDGVWRNFRTSSDLASEQYLIHPVLSAVMDRSNGTSTSADNSTTVFYSWILDGNNNGYVGWNNVSGEMRIYRVQNLTTLTLLATKTDVANPSSTLIARALQLSVAADGTISLAMKYSSTPTSTYTYILTATDTTYSKFVKIGFSSEYGNTVVSAGRQFNLDDVTLTADVYTPPVYDINYSQAFNGLQSSVDQVKTLPTFASSAYDYWYTNMTTSSYYLYDKWWRGSDATGDGDYRLFQSSTTSSYTDGVWRSFRTSSTLASDEYLVTPILSAIVERGYGLATEADSATTIFYIWLLDENNNGYVGWNNVAGEMRIYRVKNLTTLTLLGTKTDVTLPTSNIIRALQLSVSDDGTVSLAMKYTSTLPSAYAYILSVSDSTYSQFIKIGFSSAYDNSVYSTGRQFNLDDVTLKANVYALENPDGYNRPDLIPQGSATIDGSLSDWSGAVWTPLNVAYDLTSSTSSALLEDIPEAYYAARWQIDKIYVAVKVRDTAHSFMDNYDYWNSRDAVEIYLHTDSTDDTTYALARTAQQYTFGIMDSNHSALWMAIGGNSIPYPITSEYASLAAQIGSYAGQLGNDGWIYYEVAITPFTYFNGLEDYSLVNSTTSTLTSGEVIGLDVCVVGCNNGTYAGMKGENALTGKSGNWKKFGRHKLTDTLDVLDTLSLGHRILIEKGLQIQTQVFPRLEDTNTEVGFDMDLFTQSNFTTANFHQNKSVYSYFDDPETCPYWGRYSSLAGDYLSVAETSYLDKMVSYQLWDEQDVSDLDQQVAAGKWFSRIHALYPDVIYHTNQWGDEISSTNMQAYMLAACPSMVMFDTYPFNGSLEGGSPTTWYSHMQKYRLLGLAGNDGTGTTPIPYALYTQTFTVNGHEPSESEMYLNEFSAWAFGYKFISAFTYTNPFSASYATQIDSILFDGVGDGTPTTKFYQLAETNRQSKNLGPALVRLISTDVRMVMGKHGTSGTTNTTPDNVTADISGADAYLKGISVTAHPSSINNNQPGDVIIGFFKPLDESFDGTTYSNQKYFMVVNGLSDAAATSSATQQTIRLTFNFGSSGITSLQRLSRTTGKVETVSLTSNGTGGYYVDITLDGGTGDLFKYKTGAPFVGVVLAGDFNTDYVVNATDIDLLSAAINSHSTNYATYDLTKDSLINSADMDYLIKTILHTYYGDADLNGSVGVSDLSVLAAYYNTPSGASWANGDFDGNGAVGVSDLSILAANYNSGSASTVSWAEAYAQAFGTTSDVAVDDASDEATADEEDTSSTICSSLGLSLIAGLALMGLMIVKLEE
jgi:hypothetical protein